MREPLTDDAPFQGAEHFPEMHGRDVNGDAGCRLVMLVKRSAFAEAADWQRIAAEAPRAQAEPAEVFHCVAAMRKFPVEHAAQSRSQESRVGNECVSPCSSRGSPEHSKKKKKK